MGSPPFRGATEYLTFQAILAADQLGYPAHVSASARVTVDAMLRREPERRCASLSVLQQLPFFAEVQWDTVWAAEGAAVPPVLPPQVRPAGGAAAAETDLVELAAEPQPTAPPEPSVPWRLLPDERELLCGAATRKRGRRSLPGRLVLTSSGRLALVGDGSEVLLHAASVQQACLRAVDECHLALRTDGGEEAILEVLAGTGASWISASSGLLATRP